MTASELKASILDQAIRGKLVPQDPTDEPAGELLKRIAAEKMKLIAEKKIKKEKVEECDLVALPDYSTPEGWLVSRIGKVFNLQAGENIASSSISETPFDGSVPCFGGNGIRGYVKQANRTGIHAIVGRQGALCGNLNISTDRFYATEHAVVVDCFAQVSPQFAFWFLQAMNLNQFATATAQPGLSVAVIDQVEFPLPPLAEQKRIVAMIEELMPLVERYGKAETRRRELVAALPADLKKSILQEAIQGKLVSQDPNDEPASELLKRIAAERAKLATKGRGRTPAAPSPITDDEKPFKSPDGWSWCRLGDIGVWGSGATPSKSNPAYFKGGTIPWLLTGDLTDGHVGHIPNRITELALEETSLRLNPVGSVLIAMYGATIGKLGILDIPATTNQACCACRVYDSISNEFLFWYLLSKRDELRKLAEGGAQPNISKEKIVNMPIPLPPLAEQKRIVARVEELLAVVGTMEDSCKS